MSAATQAGQRSATDLLADNYLAKLLSYPLETLKREPETLRSQEQALKQELEETAVQNYQGFIHTATCFDKVSTDIQDVQSQLKELNADLQHLQSQATAFTDTASQYQEKHRLNRALLARHSTVLELLEVPQLIDTCVRNNNFDEALDLMSFVNKLAASHSTTPVVVLLAQEVQSCQQILLEHLFERLGRNVTLSECLRCVSYLRRLGCYSEAQLRLRFLQCREHWLQQVVDGVDDTNAAEFLRQLTDVYRLNLFDIIMQYRAIFFEADSDSQSAPDQGSSAANGNVQPAGSSSRALHSWALHRVNAYISKLEQYLPRIQDGNALAAVVEGCLYCGRSLARVGLDMRSLLTPTIAGTVHALFTFHVSRAVSMFASSLEVHKWVPMPVASRSQGQKDSGSASDAMMESAYGLMAHPPLAVFINAIVTALNAIRNTALIGICPAAAEEVQVAVREVAAMLAHVPTTRNLTPAERTVHQDACRALIDVACPVVVRMFQQVFSGPSCVAPTLTEAVAPLEQCLQEAAASAAASNLGRRQSHGPKTLPPASTSASGQAAPSRPAPASKPQGARAAGGAYDHASELPRVVGTRAPQPAPTTPPAAAASRPVDTPTSAQTRPAQSHGYGFDASSSPSSPPASAKPPAAPAMDSGGAAVTTAAAKQDAPSASQAGAGAGFGGFGGFDADDDAYDDGEW